MKYKNVKLEYYVPRLDTNTNKYKHENVLEDYKERVYKGIKSKKITTREDLKIDLRNELMYHYWSKCEAEICVCNLFKVNPEQGIKIDMWFYIEPNLDMIVDYIIDKMQLDLK